MAKSAMTVIGAMFFILEDHINPSSLSGSGFAPPFNHAIGVSSGLSGLIHAIAFNSLSSSISWAACVKNLRAVLSSRETTILSVASAASIKWISFLTCDR